jgi:mannose-1-phosphate guanylyltransferase
MIALIMAGGSGTRFWPRSRGCQPKQFLRIIGEQTMIQSTVERIKSKVGSRNIFLVAGENHINHLKNQLPQIPIDNIIIEPHCRSTAPCIGLSAIHLKDRFSDDEVMMVLPADHIIENKEEFLSSVEAACQAALQDYLVTFGIVPQYPETGYGYIYLDEMVSTINDQELYRVKRFVEKPDKKRAKEYVESGKYLWNSGMFVWKIGVILEKISKHLPDLYERLLKINSALKEKRSHDKIAELYSSIEETSIDHGVMEKASDIYCLKASFQWSDVGSWSALKNILNADSHGNVCQGKLIEIDSKNNLVYSPEKLVATIGVEGLVIVNTDDVLLICDGRRDQEVKDIIKKLKERGYNKLL